MYQAFDWPASIVQLPMLACMGREATVMAPPPTHDSAVSPCFQGCPAFLYRHFSPKSPSHLLDLSLHSQQQPLPWDCSTISKLLLPAAAPSKGSKSLSGVYMAAARIVWFSFHLGCHRSTVSLLALNVSSLTQTIAPMWGSDPCFSSPTRRGQVQSYWHSCFPPRSFILLSSTWVYIFFSHCSGTPVLSQLVFCMQLCVWRCIPDASTERDVLYIELLLCLFSSDQPF